MLFAPSETESIDEPLADARNTGPGEQDAGINCDEVPSGWSRVGGLIEPPGGHFEVGDIAIDASGRPNIVFSSGAPASGYVYRFDGTTWAQVAGALEVYPGGIVYDPSIRLLGEDIVVMFLERDGGETGVYLRRLDTFSNSWQTMSGGGDDGKLSTASASVAGSDMYVDGSELLVAWSQSSDGGSGQNRVQVGRFSPDYVTLAPAIGGVTGSGASAITPSVTVDSDGNVVVFVSESGVQHFERNAVDWQYKGEVLPADGFGPKATSDSKGRVVLVTAGPSDPEVSNQAFVQRYSDGAWDAIGVYQPVTGAGTHVTPTAVIVDDFDEPIVAITESTGIGEPIALFVGHHVGDGVFETLGDSPLTGGDGTQDVLKPRMAKDTCGFYLSFVEAVDVDSDRSVHVYRWKF